MIFGPPLLSVLQEPWTLRKKRGQPCLLRREIPILEDWSRVLHQAYFHRHILSQLQQIALGNKPRDPMCQTRPCSGHSRPSFRKGNMDHWFVWIRLPCRSHHTVIKVLALESVTWRGHTRLVFWVSWLVADPTYKQNESTSANNHWMAFNMQVIAIASYLQGKIGDLCGSEVIRYHLLNRKSR